MFVDKKGLNKVFRLGLFGLYALGFGLTVGVRSAEYVNVIGDYNTSNTDINFRINEGSNYVIELSPSFNVNVVYSYKQSFDFNLDVDNDFYRISYYNYNGTLIDNVSLTFDEFSNPSYLASTYLTGGATGGTYYIAYFNDGTSSSFTFTLGCRSNYVELDQTDSDFLGVQSLFYNAIEFNVYQTQAYLGYNYYFYDDQISLNFDTWYGYIAINNDSNFPVNTAYYYRSSVSPYICLSNFTDDFTLSFNVMSFLGTNPSYELGYQKGFTDGENYVLQNPDEFDLVSYADYLTYGTSKYNEGLEAGSNVLSMSGVMNAIFTAPISMFAQIFRSGAFVWTMPTGEVLDLGGLMTFFLTIGIALAVVRLILKVGSK